MTLKLKPLDRTEFLRLLKKGKTIETRVCLNGGFFSRHIFSMDDGVIRDESMVDGSVSYSSIKEFDKDIYRKALDSKAMYLEEIIAH